MDNLMTKFRTKPNPSPLLDTSLAILLNINKLVFYYQYLPKIFLYQKEKEKISIAFDNQCMT
jgi:hypothetical protein